MPKPVGKLVLKALLPNGQDVGGGAWKSSEGSQRFLQVFVRLALSRLTRSPGRVPTLK